MDQSNTKGKGVGLIVSAILGAFLAGFFFSISANAKEDWRYYWDEDYRAMMNVLHAGGWIMVVSSVVEFIAGLVFVANAKDEENWTSTNLITCPDCHNKISRQAETCPHCGRKSGYQSIIKNSSSVSNPTAPNQYIPTWKRIQMMEEEKNSEQQKCAFCGEVLSEGQRFCSGCGRRRD